jgi:U3 small nucleolar RNA-associated protein 24
MGSQHLLLCREKVSSAMFFKYNTQLGPPYQVLVDTNFINFSIKNKVRM